MYSKLKGLTLVELMITIAVAAVVLSIGVPSFSDMIRNNRMVSNTSSFLMALNLARSEAVRRNSRVVICESSDGAVCADVLEWEDGWLIFEDNNNDAQVDNGEEIIRYHAGIANTDTIRLNSGNINNYISYNPTGNSRLISNTSQSGRLIFCTGNELTDAARVIDINQAGKARTFLASELGVTSCEL